MRIGFIGLGQVGGKLAGSVLRNGFDLTVHDLDPALTAEFKARGADVAESPADMAKSVDIVITCLPSPAACSAVIEGDNGVLSAAHDGLIWLEMSTTDAGEVTRLGAAMAQAGARTLDCPVSGGCHRAATGNISIFAGGDRADFDAVLPVLTVLGRRVLHTGALGTASQLKVVTNYLATANLLAVTEALATCAGAGLDLKKAYEAIAISSGTSFVHETEGQVILSGSRQIDFTIDLVLKDIGLFQAMADDANVPLELSPMLIDIFKDGADRFGPRAQSDDIIRRLEDPTGLDVTAPGFPAELVDDEPEEPGYEVGR
ncbi:MAG: NAD(P)-dependent oxidoreductase [Pseudomonadota bacterium]